MKQAPPAVSGKLTALFDRRLRGGAMETIYIGVDFHARQQTICYLKTETGERVTCELKHQDKQAVRAFYAQFGGQMIVGLEASGYSPWFERLLEELGCEVWLGHATEIRRRARCRQKLIKIRTMSKNSLQALALQAGVARRSHLFTREGKQELAAALMSPAMQWQREHWLQLLQPLNQQVLEAMVWLKAQSKGDVEVARLRTHPGIGLLTSLCLAHTLQPID